MSDRGRGQVPAIYEEAIKKYEEITKKKLDDPALLKLTRVDDLLAEIEKKNDKFSDFRETKHVFFDLLEAAMKPVELVGNLAAGAASMAFPPSSLVFGAVSYLIGAAKGVTASYDAIQDLLGSLRNFTVRLRIYSREQISKELSNQLSDILVTLIDIFALSTKAIKGGRFLKFARNMLIGNDDKIQGAVGRLAKLTEIEDRLVGAETLTEAKRSGRLINDVAITLGATHITVNETGQTVGRMSREVTELNVKVENLMQTIDNSSKAEQAKDHQDIIKNVLQPSVTAQDWYDKINKSRVTGTGDWIRSEELFKSWIAKEGPVLWISGNPGAGKSYLSSNMISYLLEQHPQGVQHPSLVSVGYFFFKDDNPKTRSFHQALRDLAYQISQNDPIYAKYITSSCSSPEDINTLTSAWRNLFANFFIKKTNLTSSLYVVIDGVDEAYEGERRAFFDLLRDANEVTSCSRIQIVLVGRPHLYDAIFEALEDDVPTIHVTEHKNSADIVHYIEESIRKSSILRRVSAKLRSEIVTKLSEGAQGMFIWVDFMLKELFKKRSESSIRKSLDEAPRGLNEMLRHVLKSFSSSLVDEESRILNDLLAWVTCAERPLTLGELDSLMKHKSPDGDGVIYLEGCLRKQFASFFSLTREDGLTTSELHLLRQNIGDSDDEDRGVGRREEAFEDVENVTDFDSDPISTEVTFCHSSIGDFFRNEKEGKVSAGDEYPAIGVNFNEAKLDVVKTCVQLFCDAEMWNKLKGAIGISILGYVFEHWTSHLEALDPSTVGIVEKKEIASLLARMLSQVSTMEIWAALINWRFFGPLSLDLFRKWLDDPEVKGSFSAESQELINSSKSNPAIIFKPVAGYIAKEWLEKPQWIAENCCDMVYSYICLEKGTPLDVDFSGYKSAAEIIAVAKWASLEKNALWYRRVGIALRERGMYDEAVEYFSRALDLDETMLIARCGMSITYMRQGKYEKSIRVDEISGRLYQQKLIDEPENLAVQNFHLHQVQERMAKSYEKLGDEENAFRCSKNAHEANPNCDECTCKTISKMSARGFHSDIIVMLKAMKGMPEPNKDHCCLTESLWKNKFDQSDYFHWVTKAALETNEMSFLKDAYREAIRAARKESATVTASWLELKLARIYSLYTPEQHKAIPIWTKLIETLAGAKTGTDSGDAKTEAMYELARQSLRQALDAGIGSPAADTFVKRLERLAKSRARTGDDSSTFISANDPAIMLGLWYRLNGLVEDSKACFRPSVKAAIEILSDDDLGNDADGYYKLFNILIAAGEFNYVLALLYHLGDYPHENRNEGPDTKVEGSIVANGEGKVTERKTEAEGEKEKCKPIGKDDEEDDKENIGCDGPCGRWFPIYDNLHMCKFCMDVAFCDECIKLVKDGSLQSNICSSQHDWFFIPPLPQKIEAGKILLDGVQVDEEGFKRDIKQRWLV